MKKGTLYLIPSTLGDTKPADVLPERTLQVIRSLDSFIVEEVRSARRFLRKAGFTRDFNACQLLVYNEHTRPFELASFLSPLLEGKDTGLLSEAGTPCIADPGAEIVSMARQEGIRIVPLTGPSSILLALMASGFNGQRFVFHGYLPVDKRERQKRIREIERDAWEKDQTQIFMETPYRNSSMYETLLRTCKPATRLCIAINLTTMEEQILGDTIEEWQKTTWKIPKQPAIFLLYQ